MLAYILDQKLLNRKLSFWLPFRAMQYENKKNYAYIKELKIDYGDKAFDRNQLESELATRINKIELRRLEDDLDLLE